MKCKILFLKTCVWGPGFWWRNKCKKRGTCIKQNTKSGEIRLLMVYRLQIGSRKHRLHYACYITFFKGIMYLVILNSLLLKKSEGC